MASNPMIKLNGATQPQLAHRVHGFTLMELMIVTAIIAILAAIAYPSYTEQVARSRRANAKAALQEAAQWLERNYTISNNFSKDAAGNDINDTVLSAAPLPSRAEISRFYTVSFVENEPTSNTFALQAVPTGSMANDRCGTFILNQASEKSLVNSNDDTLRRDCWER